MSAQWESVTLSRVAVPPAALADEVATDLCEPSRIVTEVLVECLETLDAALELDASELLADHFRWQVTRLAVVAPHLTQDEVVSAICAALEQHAGPGVLHEVERHLRTAVAAAGEQPASVDPPLSRKAQAYLDHVLRGERDAAVDIVLDEVARGTDAQDILLDVLQPVQIEIGRLWEQGRASVAHEHLCTAVTQLCMSMLWPRLNEGAHHHDRTVVATSVGGEAHEIGVRIVADLLKRDGWRTFYLGGGVPASDVVSMLLEQRADVLAVSATMAGHVPAVRRLIHAVRDEPRCVDVKVVVGGRPFLVVPRLGKAVGADGLAPDAADAVGLCNALVSQTRSSSASRSARERVDS
jgi:MerR family transcriptional regulator, light-induced transcriptional regulator